MNRSHLVVALSVLAGLALAPWTQASPKTKARLAAGEIIVSTKKVPGSEQPIATVMAVVNAPPARLWRIISKCSDYKRTMVRVAASRQVWQKGDVHRCQVTVDLPFPLSDLTATTDAVHTVVPGKRWERKWKLVEGDYTRNSGSWTLAPFDATGQRTLVIYKVHAEPNVPIPDGIRRAAQRKSLPNLIENLRKQVAR
ncbi:MAG: SRPBCC family protein [Myxococcota bacterium]|nr:SRPBCC family protein [Myxococcota bacterium]